MDKLAIIEEIEEFCDAPSLAEDEVTARQYADSRGITVRKAQYRLEKSLRDGFLTRRMVLHDAHRTWAYSKKSADG